MDTLLAALHAVAWAIYVGGSATMELILRYAQRTMPPSQVGVVCKNAGTRYRWLALGALTVIGATGALMLWRIDDRSLSLAHSYGRTMLLLGLCWALLAATVGLMAFWLHPAQRKRSRPEMSQEEVAAERLRIGTAIRRMDRALKFELVLAVISVGIGSTLRTGGLI